MLQLHQALFIGLLRYSSPVLSKTCMSNIRALQSVQAQSLRVCLGLPRSTSTAGTVILARDYPVTTYITTDALRAHIRHTSRMVSSHLPYLPEKRPQASFSNVVSSHRALLPSGFTPSARSPSALWCLHQPEVRLSIPGIRKKKNLSTLALKQAALDCLHTFYADRIHVYTDGSTTQTSSTGATVIPSRHIHLTYKLCHVSTSTGSELAALRGAVNHIKEQPANRWAVFCDSKAALQCLSSALRRGSYEQLVWEIREMLHNVTEQGHDVVFQWLPSHCGISGNDLADEAAREAHGETSLVSIPLSRIDAARYLSKLAQNMTLQMWRTSQFTDQRLYSLDPSLRLRLLPGLSREEDTVLCRLRLGVAFTGAEHDVADVANITVHRPTIILSRPIFTTAASTWPLPGGRHRAVPSASGSGIHERLLI
uniref:Putative tick transposon n=1 Tax=Rhipicephalus pulchellus TaxID=72859 RepID=L7LW84_RHIPC